MNDYDLELIGFYKSRVSECIGYIEALSRWAPDDQREAVMTHMEKLKSVMAAVERSREAAQQ